MASPNTPTYPPRLPKNHNPPPRLNLVFPETQEQVFTAYVGIQIREEHRETENATSNTLLSLFEPRSKIKSWLENNPPISIEQFIVLDDEQKHPHGQTAIPNRFRDQDCNSNYSISKGHATLIWVCYWTNKPSYENALSALNLSSIHASLPESQQESVGFWLETFVSDIARLETVYSATDYLPGLARIPGTSTAKHIHTGYWGAARDRIPGSGEDLFIGDESPGTKKEKEEVDIAEHDVRETARVKGTNHSDMVHIRSGQFWQSCAEEEEKAYLENIEPKLRGGLSYLWTNPHESGSLAVRYLRNTRLDLGLESSEAECSDETTNSKLLDKLPKESCVTAFFNNMTDLERWASKQPSHLAIHAAAVSHARRFGDERLFRTWHEVSVIRGGEARFEYVNCLDGTGIGDGMVLVK